MVVVIFLGVSKVYLDVNMSPELIIDFSWVGFKFDELRDIEGII